MALSGFDFPDKQMAIFEAGYPSSPLSLAPQLSLQLLDPAPVLLRLLWARRRLFRFGQRLPGRFAPLREFLRINPVLPAPGISGRLIPCRRGEHRLEPGCRCLGPLASGPRQRMGTLLPPSQSAGQWKWQAETRASKRTCLSYLSTTWRPNRTREQKLESSLSFSLLP